ncbi:hypothetical protein Aduo_003481 [Ancylostoma duodenale]
MVSKRQNSTCQGDTEAASASTPAQTGARPKRLAKSHECDKLTLVTDPLKLVVPCDSSYIAERTADFAET